MTLDGIETEYLAWLLRQPLAEQTRHTYQQWVRKYLHFLCHYPAAYGDPLVDPNARDYAIRDFKAHLKTVQRLQPASVNVALAALDHFYQHFQQLGAPHVRRESLPQQAPRALTPEEQKRFLRAVDRHRVVRDRAIAILLFYTGLRISECVALNVDDITVSDRKGRVIVRQGKGDRYREIPLNAPARHALTQWLGERKVASGDAEQPALFLARSGQRLARRTIDVLIRQLGHAAGVELSAHVLRHTCFTNLIRQGQDVVLVAEIAGHQRLDTTRRYSLPSAQDREAAMDGLAIDI